jgi:hypothetical protein
MRLSSRTASPVLAMFPSHWVQPQCHFLQFVRCMQNIRLSHDWKQAVQRQMLSVRYTTAAGLVSVLHNRLSHGTDATSSLLSGGILVRYPSCVFVWPLCNARIHIVAPDSISPACLTHPSTNLYASIGMVLCNGSTTILPSKRVTT